MVLKKIPIEKFLSVSTWALLGCALAYSTVAIASFPHWTIDDAYITYRYSANLANHGELTWNIGRDPVEGYTGVLLPVMLACGTYLNLSIDGLSKTIGISAYFVSFAFLLLTLRRSSTPKEIIAATLLLYSSIPILYIHAWSGLETVLFTALLSVSLYLLLTALVIHESSLRSSVGLCLCMTLTALCRPEGIAFAAIGLSVLLLSYRSSSKDLTHIFGYIIIFTALPLAIYFTWRWSYYGNALPNTYYAKARSSYQGKSIKSFLTFMQTFYFAPMIILGMVCISNLGFLKERSNSKPYSALKPIWLCTAAVSGFLIVVLSQYAFSNLRMNISFRFFTPITPLACFLIAIITSSAIKAHHRQRTQAILSCLFILTSIYQFKINASLYPHEAKVAADYKQLIEHVHINAGKFLHETIPPNEWLCVIIDAGAMPFYSKLNTIDFGGLNDEFLSKRRHAKIPKPVQADYLFSHNPGAIVITSKKPGRLDRKKMRRYGYIVNDERFNNYILVKTFGSPFQNYFEFVYIRRDLTPTNSDAVPSYSGAQAPEA